MTMRDEVANSTEQSTPRLGLAGRIARSFIDSKLTPLVIVAALLLGAFSILQTPREEEPQIVVPMLDVFVQMPAQRRKKSRSGSACPWRNCCAKCVVSNTFIPSASRA